MTEQTCSTADCDRPVHARGLCPAHYNRWRRANPDQPVRKRVAPTATLSDRVAAHTVPDGEHLIWTGFRNDGVPGICIDGHTANRKVYNVRRLQLEQAGFPKPPGRWVAAPTCGNPDCVAPAHLTWRNHRSDAVLTSVVVDSLIAQHAAGALNVADEADRLGVTRQTIYKAMRRRGYVTSGR